MKTLRSLVGIILVTASLSCSKPEPTFDPFDDVYNVNMNRVRSLSDTLVSAGCGFFNYMKTFDGFSVGYQFYVDDSEEVCAKVAGFMLDTIQYTGEDSGWWGCGDTCLDVDLSLGRLNEVLLGFGLQYQGKGTNWLEYFDSNGDLYELEASVWYDTTKEIGVRYVGYYTPSPAE